MLKIDRFSYVLIFTILLSLGCTNDTKKYVSKNKVVIDDVLNKNIGDLLTYTVNHEVVCLETKDESLINEITDVRNINNNIYVFDKRQKSLFIFSQDGHFIYKINRFGKSQSEYFEIKSFDVNVDGEIVILDNIGMKLLLIDSLGGFKESIPLAKKSDYETVSFLTDSTFCITSKGAYEKYVGNDYMLHTFDKNGSLLCSELSLGDEYNKLILMENFKLNIYRRNNELCFNFPFDNKIFVKSQDSLFCKTEIIFQGKDSIEMLYRNFEKIKNNGVVASLVNTNIVTVGSSLIEKNNYILTTIYDSNPAIKYLLYNKTNQQSTYYKFNLTKFDELMIGRPVLYNGNNDKLISVIIPSNVKRILDNDVVYENDVHKLMYDKLKTLSIEEDQNPMLLFFELEI